jgi:hypothetical protein
MKNYRIYRKYRKKIQGNNKTMIIYQLEVAYVCSRLTIQFNKFWEMGRDGMGFSGMINNLMRI